MTPLQKLNIFYEPYESIKFRRRDIILDSGDEPDGMYYLCRGNIRQSAHNKNGSLYVHIYKPGSFFPLMWLFNNTANKYAYKAINTVSVKCAPRSAVELFLKKHPDVIEYFTGRLLLGVDGLLARLESLVLDDAYTKTIKLFMYLASAFGKKNKGSVIIRIPIRHKHIGFWIGTTRETASIQAEKLIAKKMLVRDKSIYTIPDLEKLKKEVK